MKRYMGISSLILGLGLLVGCEKTPEQPPVPSAAEYETQKMDYQKSMDAGAAAAGGAGGTAPSAGSGN